MDVVDILVRFPRNYYMLRFDKPRPFYAFFIEVPAHATRLSQLAAANLEDFAYFRSGSITIVGKSRRHNGDSIRTITFIEHFFIFDRIEFAGSALDRARNIVFRHIHRARFRDRRAQTNIIVGITAALFMSIFENDKINLGIRIYAC